MKNLLFFPILLLAATLCRAQWTTENLSEAKSAMGAVAPAGSNTFWFAGGWPESGMSNKVEIYHALSEEWTYSELSEARSYIAATAHGSLVCFAGGLNFLNQQSTATVDIWNGQLQQWTTAQLSAPRFSLSAVAGNGKVLFAGGANLQTGSSYDNVDVYDTLSQQWTTAALSEPRCAMGSAVVQTPDGLIALFAGGFKFGTFTVSDRVDIYNFNTGVWSTATLSEPRGFAGATAIDGKVLIAGGTTNANTPSDRVDIFDAATGVWTTASLSKPRAFIENSASACGKAFFAGGGTFSLFTQTWETASKVVDIYDVEKNEWSVDYLPYLLVNHSVIADGNRVIIAGGEFSLTVYSNLNIYTLDPSTCTVAVKEEISRTPIARIYPNPSAGIIHLESLDNHSDAVWQVKMATLQGKIVYNQTRSSSDISLNLPELPAGVYLLTVGTNKTLQTVRIVVE